MWGQGWDCGLVTTPPFPRRICSQTANLELGFSSWHGVALSKSLNSCVSAVDNQAIKGA